MKNFKGGFFLFYYFWLLIFLFISLHDAYPISFRLYDEGAKAQGQAGAFTAQADDASALYYNPAAITQLKGDQVLSGTEFLLLSTDYTSTSGVEESDTNDWAIVPHFYAVHHVNKKWAVGFGTYSLFGLATEYSDTGVFRYVATSSELRTMTISPAIAYQILPQLSFSAGPTFIVGTLDLRSKVDFGALAGLSGALDGDSRLAGDGEGFGFQVSLLFEPHPQHRLGLMFLSPVDFDVDGSATVSNIPSFVGVGSTVTGDFSSELDLPAVLRFGYAFFPTHRWKIEFDLDGSNFSTFEDLPITSTNPLVGSQSVPKNYQDGYVFALGTEYELNEDWTVRLGYGYINLSLAFSSLSLGKNSLWE
ncbi:MAG: outer membrane protein transport protein [Chlamydiae bacterium]|nr:outer membrane protein transport protein [Chlamydiota bacterium]